MGGPIRRHHPPSWVAPSARTIIGYHGCRADFAHDVLLGNVSIDAWKPSANEWDWLGHGIYFWEHSPQRALRWAQEKYEQPAVLGAVVQLGKCFDLLDESVTAALFVGHQRKSGTRPAKP